MIKSEGFDVYINGKPADVLQDFQQIVVCFRSWISDKAIEINSKADPDDAVIELFCQALKNNGPAQIRTIVDVSGLEAALDMIKDDEEEEET